MSGRLGFRGRLVAAAAVVSLVSLGCGFAAVSFLVNQSQQRQLDEALSAVAQDEAKELAGATGALHISDRPGPAANDVGPLPKLGVVYGPDGQIVSSTPNLRGHAPQLSDADPGHERCFDMWFKGEHLRAVLVPVPEHRGTRLLIAAPRADLDGDAAFLTRAMLAVFVFAMAWTVALAIGILGRLTRHHRVIALTAQRVAGGDLSARVGTLGGRDDVAELGHNIDEMIERLGLLLKGQQQFIAHAAHELRSPLATLYGELSHALRRSRTAEEYRRAIEEALDSARTLKTLAEDLLGLARLGAERVATADVVAVADLLKQAIAGVSGEQAVRQVTADVTCPADAAIQGRAGDLGRLFRNLLENAVRHAPFGSVVRISVVSVGANVEIRILDDGEGVSESERARVFDPFFRGATVRAANHPGAGLGLTIARDIARLHGGDIILSETTGQAGASFVVRLPAASGSLESASTNSAPSAGVHGRSG